MKPPCPTCGRAYRVAPNDKFTDDLLAAAKLDVPARRPYGDDFYRRVAAIHDRVVEDNVGAYGAVIAAANGVPLSTTQRWIRETRRRGFLPPARHGSYR